MKRCAFAIILASSCCAAFAQEVPRLPFYSWGACPFECCTYRDWKAEQPVALHVTRSAKSRVVVTAKKGEWVRGQDGVVITTRYGISKIVKPWELGYTKSGAHPQLRLVPGQIVYPLHYLGEGNYLFWYRGKTYIDEVSALKPDTVPLDPELKIQVVQPPSYVWWARVRSKSGAVGWTSELEKFSNVDACG